MLHTIVEVMPKLPRWMAVEAERALFGCGFETLPFKGSPRIYVKGVLRVTSRSLGAQFCTRKSSGRVLEAIQDVGLTKRTGAIGSNKRPRVRRST